MISFRHAKFAHIPSLPHIVETLASSWRAIVYAEPGTGKTTDIPLTLLEAGWLEAQKIVSLEPIRMSW